MKRWIFLGFLLLWPTLLFAQSALSLTPPSTDLSFQYLNDMFGQVDGVLTGGDSQLLGVLFGVFNGAMLTLAGIIVLYTFFIGTLKTAHEGEVLGKDWSSVWIPLRVVAGITLLIPKASGYSFIQIFMMWVIVQGIGVADSVWNAALNYLYSGGIIISQTYNPQSAQSSSYPMIVTSAKLLRSLTCVEMLQLQLNNYRNTQVKNGNPAIDQPPDFVSDILAAITASTESGTPPQNTVQFPQSGYYNTDGVCGTVQWQDVWHDLPAAMQSNQQFLATWQNNKSRSTALYNTISQLQPYAINIANNYFLHATVPATALPLGQMNANGTWSGPNNGPFLIKGSVLGDAATAYNNVMSTTMIAIASSANSGTYDASWTLPAKQKGWALAGAYYFNVVEANSQISGVMTGSLPQVVTEASFDFTNVSGVTNQLGGKSSTYVLQLQSLLNGQNSTSSNPSSSNKDDYIVSTSSLFISNAVTYASGMSYSSNSQMQNGTAGQMVAPAAGASGGVSNFLSGIGNSGANDNPVIDLAKFGDTLVIISFVALILMSVIGFGGTIALGAIPFCSVGAAGVSLVTAMNSLFTPIFVTLMTTGLTMAYYIPMIPFIIFSFGVLGWFISVAEAMLAAPLVALGISHPEGSHAVLGKADPAVGLLVNVFLRPTFMIFGLLTGMMLSYVGVWLLNAGFSQAFGTATEQTSSSIGAAIFKPIASIIIYVLIVIQIVQKSFSLIHVIPDQVLRWIGINITSMGGEAEAEGAISAKAKSGMAQIAGSAGSATKMGTGAGKGAGGAIKSGIEEGGSSGGTASGASGGAGGAGGAAPPPT